MAYRDFKDLDRRNAADKILCDKGFNILPKIQNMVDIKGFLLQWFINFLIKKLLVAALKIKIFLKRISGKITKTNY